MSKGKDIHNSNCTTRYILATNITYLRHEMGWSQIELAERSGRSLTVISSIENAKISAGVDVIDDIASAFGWTTPELTTDHKFVVTKKRVDGRQ